MEMKTMKEKAFEKVFKAYSRAASYSARGKWGLGNDQDEKADHIVEAYFAIGLMTYEEGHKEKIKAYHEYGIEIKECDE